MIIQKTIVRSSMFLAVVAGNMAYAQQDSTEDLFLEEIIVTAQKRAQSSQDVGLAITAISGAAMMEQGITSGNDIGKAIPNVDVKNHGGGGLGVVIVRGIGLQNFRINDSPTTSFYVDEVYQTSIAAVDFAMFDMERLEVLKGPQGGLYGRNTIGGAVQVISKPAVIGADANGFLNLTYGQYDQTNTEFAAGVPLSDKAAIRVSGRVERSDGKQYNSTVTGEDYGEDDRWATRVMLSLAPSESVDLQFKLHAGADNSELSLARSVGLYQNIGTGAGLTALTGVPFYSNLSLALLSGQSSAALCDSILAGNGSNSNTCATVSGVTPEAYGQTDGDIYSSSSAGYEPKLDSTWAGASLMASFEFEDYTLTSISAYDNIDYRRFIESDATPVLLMQIDYGTEIDFWSQEFRLSYDGEENFSWIAGINYSGDKLEENTILYSEGFLPLLYAATGLTVVFAPQDYAQESEALAVYGHGEWQFADQWQFVGELRYTNEEKTFEGTSSLGDISGAIVPFLSVDDDTRFESFSGKVGLNWTPNDNMLYYASISEGFKVGGFFGGFATSIEQLEPYDEETILAYEMGLKTDWLDHRLRMNAALFYYDRKNVQSSAADATATVRISRLSNIGDVVSYGGELDLTWLASQNLTLQLGLGYTDAEIVDSDFVASGLQVLDAASLEGANVPSYSKASANFLARYEQPIGASLLAHAQFEYSYRSERDLGIIINSAIEEAIFKEPSYELVNLRLGLADTEAGWRVSAFVENLFEEEYRVQIDGDGLYGMRELYGDPRVWGVGFNYEW